MPSLKSRAEDLHLSLLLALMAIVLVAALWSSGTTSASAPNGPALYLDGNDDYATAADSASLDLGVTEEDFTVETFFYVPDLGNQSTDTMIWKQGSYGVYTIFNTSSPDRVIFRIWTGFSTYNFIYADVDLSVGWHHLAAVFGQENTPAADLMALYLDGNLASSSTAFEWTPGIPNSSSALNVGAYVGVNPVSGWLDETRFSNSIRYSGNSYVVPSEPFSADANTRALWHFDEAVGSTIFADASGNGNTLTGQSGAATGDPPGPPTPTPSATPSPTPIPSGKGDVDCDDHVTVEDMFAILTHVAGLRAASSSQGDTCPAIGSDTGDGIHGDVNCDDIVDSRDALTILLFVAGLPLNLPVGCDGP